ncbi:MAG: toll/interleukin-1 receptor domain-containing protein [Sulfuritalea sp.]|jgi:hypothetical protein|nr:toll/interleukin-1 receptor domain-containing protein [Sulfuritalea sp.]
MRIFLSWSGLESKKAAKVVKEWLTKVVFAGEKIDPFMSEKDIPYGADWLATLKTKLADADCAIICLTADNLKSPWLNFEGGAISIVKDKLAIPLLINIDRDKISGPYQHFQSVTLDIEGVEKLVLDLKQLGKFRSPHENHLPKLLPDFFDKLVSGIKAELKSVERDYDMSGFSIYPEQVTSIKRGKVFIGAPMASLPRSEYAEMRRNVLLVRDALKQHTSATEIYCPCERISSPGKFDDVKKAIYEDFKILKESEYYLFLYPQKSASSVLLEMGYAIALSKKTKIFTRRRSELPFMLKRADEAIRNLQVFPYRSVDQIVGKIEREGMSFLD